MPGPAEVNVTPANLIRRNRRVTHNERTAKLAPRLASAYAQSQYQPTINSRSQLKNNRIELRYRSYADLRKVRPQGRTSQLDIPGMLKVQQPRTALSVLF